MLFESKRVAVISAVICYYKTWWFWVYIAISQPSKLDYVFTRSYWSYTSTVIQCSCAHVASCKGGGPRVVVSTAAFHARVRGSVPGLGGWKKQKMFLPHPRVKVSIVGSLRDREVACSVSDRQGSNFESCAWWTVSSQSSHHPQEVLLAQFSLYVHKGGLKPDSFHFCFLQTVVPSTVLFSALLIFVSCNFRLIMFWSYYCNKWCNTTRINTYASLYSINLPLLSHQMFSYQTWLIISSTRH